jgi:ribonuclease HII
MVRGLLQPFLLQRTVLLLQRRSFVSTRLTFVEFTQGGASNVGGHSRPQFSTKKNKQKKIKVWKNESSRSKQVVYATTQHANGDFHCDCPGFRFRKSCKHVDVARQSNVKESLAERVQVLKKAPTGGSGDNFDLNRKDMLVVGIDEAGAGPVLGPMVFCAVVLSRGVEAALKAEGVRDSKDVPPSKRELLRNRVVEEAIEYDLVVVDAADIDRRRKKGESMNMIKVRAVSDLLLGLRSNPSTAYIDAFDGIATKHDDVFQKQLVGKGPNETIIVSEHRADSRYTVVGAASLIAKTERDSMMRELEKGEGVALGSGYPADPKTLAYLAQCNGTFPTFVRQSWKTVDRFRV